MGRIESGQNKLGQLQSYLQQDPENLSLILATSECLLQLGQFIESESLIHQALDKQPEKPELLFLLATIKLAMQQPNAAITPLNTLCKLGIEHPSIHYNLAYAYFMKKDFEIAWSILEKLIQTEMATLPEAAILGAKVLHHLGKVTEAITLIEKHRQQIHTSETLGLLSLLYFDNQQPDLARQTAEQALTLDPQESQAQLTQATLQLDEVHCEQALTQFNHLLKINPENGRAYHGRGIAKMFLLDLTGAIKDFQTAIQYLPTFLGNYQALGWCQLANNNISAAKMTFEECLRQDRNFAETHGGLAVIDIIQGNLIEVQQKIQRALKLNANSFSGQFAQSLLLIQTSHAEKGQVELQKIIDTIQQQFHKNIPLIVRNRPYRYS